MINKATADKFTANKNTAHKVVFNSFTASLAALLIPAFTWAGGGSIVGNGAGLVENNFAYVYTTLANSMAECLQYQNCDLETNETTSLQKIQAVLFKNPDAAKNLIFTSEKDKPGFFDTGINQEHRIAKTCLNSGCAIYVNSGALYNTDGTPAVDLPTIASILTHELGHQAGESDHLKLDVLGSKIKRAYLMKMSHHRLPLGSGKAFVITMISQKFPQLTSDLFVGYEDQIPKNVTSELLGQIRCPQGMSLSGIEMFNGHYTGFDKTFGTHDLIKYGLWMNLSCFDPSNQSIQTETRDIEIMLSQDLIPLVMKNNRIDL